MLLSKIDYNHLSAYRAILSISSYVKLIENRFSACRSGKLKEEK